MNPKDAFISDFRIEKQTNNDLYSVQYLIETFGNDYFSVKARKTRKELKEITDRENNEYFFGINSINI